MMVKSVICCHTMINRMEYSQAMDMNDVVVKHGQGSASSLINRVISRFTLEDVVQCSFPQADDTGGSLGSRI